MSHIQLALNMLKKHEGISLMPYKDTVGKLTIGYGRNLVDRGISKEEAEYMLRNDIEQVIKGLNANIPWWIDLTEARRAVLIDMAFNLGVVGLMGFKKFLTLMDEGRYSLAAEEMMRSKWAGQVGSRAITLKNIIANG